MENAIFWIVTFSYQQTDFSYKDESWIYSMRASKDISYLLEYVNIQNDYYKNFKIKKVEMLPVIWLLEVPNKPIITTDSV